MSIRDKIMILLFDKDSFSMELCYKFLKTIVEQIKVSIAKIENIKRITYQANHDALTGLYNKEYFMKTLRGKMMAQRENDQGSKRNSLAIVDLNFFKEVNDTYGHIIGDEVLYVISQRILESLRYGDVLARIGGDEFAVLISQQSKKEVEIVVNRFQQTIAESIIIGKTDIQIGSSVGIVYDIGKYNSGELAVRDADLAMYEAKKDKSGIGSYKIFEVEIEEKFKQQHSIKERLRISSSQEEMLMKYQPIISIATGEVVGFEALIRWENDEGTIYQPNEFIPVAEESGYIEEIGKFVLDEVSKALELINNQGENYYISVNFSSKQILSLEQMECVKKLNWKNNLRIDIQENTI
jgi:diguanylate cyclase (GGDEF)-like protein